MRKYIAIALWVAFFSFNAATVVAQEMKADCNPSSCGPGDTKKGEAKVITSMRRDLQAVIDKMAKSDKGFSQDVTGLQLEAGTNDDESLLFIYQSATLVRTELTTKLQADQLLPVMKEISMKPSANKQQLVASLQKEIKAFSTQVDKL
jgi:hypothetical protein